MAGCRFAVFLRSLSLSKRPSSAPVSKSRYVAGWLPPADVADDPPSDDEGADGDDYGVAVEGVVEARKATLKGDGSQQCGDVGKAHN